MKDYLNYKDKICVVTGAASGIGRCLCEELIHLGAEIYGLDIIDPQMKGIHYIKVNLEFQKSIDEAFELIPDKIDKLFLVAGISADKRFSFETVFHVNFTANQYILDYYALKKMNSNGAIAIISSMAGVYWKEYIYEYQNIADMNGWDAVNVELEKLNKKHMVDGASYILSKRAIIYHAMKKIKVFGEHNIRINVLLPGSTLTAMTKKMIADGLKEELLKTDGVAGRLADVQEMVKPLLFLNSEMATFLTGNILLGDFGFYMMDYVGIQSNDHYYDFSVFKK